jgi:molybdopterin converting factor small subunit
LILQSIAKTLPHLEVRLLETDPADHNKKGIGFQALVRTSLHRMDTSLNAAATLAFVPPRTGV